MDACRRYDCRWLHCAWSCSWPNYIGSWPFVLWSPDLSCPAILFCRILYSMPHLSVSWKKKSDMWSPLLVCCPACLIQSATLIYLYLVTYPNQEALSPHLRTCLPSGCLQHRFKGQVVNDKREQRGQYSQRVCLKYHIYLSPQLNILSWTGIATQFTRWGMGEWSERLWTLPLGAFIVKRTVHIRI